MPVVDVNLLWTRRFRGLLPLSPNGIDGEGRLTFVRPDELEARTYQVTTAEADGRLQVRATLSVETVHKMELARAGEALIGSTDGDLYLFREERKSRFMADRRVSYEDVALSREGRIFAAAFSDALFASHSVALCEMSGKTAWTKSLGFPVTRIAVAPDGGRLVIGGEQQVVAFDAVRTLLWETFLEAPVAALALAGGSGRCVVGSATGAVTAIDGGNAAWSADVGLPVIAVAVSDAGDLVAVAAGDATGGSLLLLEEGGAPAWDYELETRPTGVSLAPNGRRVAVSTADGNLAVFAFERVEATAAGLPGGAGEIDAIAALWDAGERGEARGRLAQLLQRHPGDVAACDRLCDWDTQLIADLLEEATRLADTADFAGALRCLESARELDPGDERLPPAWRAIAQRASAALLEQGQARLEADDVEGAMELWRDLLALCPKDREAHAAIGTAQQRRAQELIAEGDALAADGDTAGAMSLWRRAQALAPEDALAQRLQEAEIRQVMEQGMRLYQERRYPEAAFQFRKALALDPEHEEARRYLGYAQNMRPGSPVTDRFTRLE